MSKRRIYRLLAAFAGAGLAYAFAKKASRRALAYSIETHTVRDRYLRSFPLRRYSASVLGCNTNVYEALPGAATQPPLLLIHGGVIEAASWMETASALATDRRILVPDLPAHGASGFLSPSKLLNWMEALIASEFGRQPIDLCGHSMGGGLALRYAARRSSGIRKLILCAPVGTGQYVPRVWPDPWNSGRRNVWPFHDSIIEKVWGDPATLTDEQRLQFGLVFRDFFYSARWWWYLCGGLRWLQDVPLSALRAIDSPALFIWGEKDRVVPFNGQRTMHRVQQVPDARIHFLEGLGHLPQVESPRAFNAVVNEFLKT